MKRSVNITEICSEGSCSVTVDYDLIPKQVRDKVDEALTESECSIELDIYQYGHQFLWDYERQNNVSFKIERGEIVQHMGDVDFYHPE